MSPFRALLPLLPAILLSGAALGVAALPGLLAPTLGGDFSVSALIALILAWLLAGLAAGRGALIAAGTVLVGVAVAAILLIVASDSASFLIPAAPFGLGALASLLPERWGELGLYLPLALSAPLAAGLGALLADRPRLTRFGALLVLLPTLVCALLAYADRADSIAIAAAGSALPALWALLITLFRRGPAPVETPAAEADQA